MGEPGNEGAKGAPGETGLPGIPGADGLPVRGQHALCSFFYFDVVSKDSDIVSKHTFLLFCFLSCFFKNVCIKSSLPCFVGVTWPART